MVVTLILIFSLSCITLSQQDDLYRCHVTTSEAIKTYGSKCYEFVLHSKLDRSHASSYCKHRGGNLVTIENLQVQSFLYHTLRNLGYGGAGVWIGLTDSGHENSYTWDSGVPLTFTHWAPGQPGILHSLEDCVLFSMADGDNGRWHDYRCSDILFLTEHDAFVCEYTMGPATTFHTVHNNYTATATALTYPSTNTSVYNTTITTKTSIPSTSKSLLTTLILTDAPVPTTSKPLATNAITSATTTELPVLIGK